MKNNLFILLAFLFSLTLVGCQTTTTHYQGAKADKEGVVSLITGQVEQQRWQDLYVTVDYSFDRQGTQFDIEGSLSFSISSQINFTQAGDIKLKLFFLDQDMRVINYLDIARTLSTRIDDKAVFNRTLHLPEGADSFTFGYEGYFIDNDPESSSSHHVWKLPKRKG